MAMVATINTLALPAGPVGSSSGRTVTTASYAATPSPTPTPTPTPTPSPTPTTVTVTPSSAYVYPGGAQQYAASVADQNGNAIANPSVTWSSGDGTSIDGNGLLTMAVGSAGSFALFAASGSATGPAAAVALEPKYVLAGHGGTATIPATSAVAAGDVYGVAGNGSTGTLSTSGGSGLTDAQSMLLASLNTAIGSIATGVNVTAWAGEPTKFSGTPGQGVSVGNRVGGVPTPPGMGSGAPVTMRAPPQNGLTPDGSIRVNQDTGGVNALQVTTAQGQPIAGAVLRAYRASDYAVSPATARLRGETTTAADGGWVQPMYLSATTGYVLVVSYPDGRPSENVALNVP